MSIGRLVHRFRRDLIEREKQDTRHITAAHNQAKQALEPHLSQIYEQIDTKQKAGETVPLHWLYEGKKLDAVKQVVTTHINRFADFARVIVGQSLHWAGSLGSRAGQALMDAVSSVQAVAQGISPGNMADLLVQASNRIALLFGGFGREAARAVGDALVRGISLGNKTEQIAQDVTQALDTSKQRATAIASTEPTQLFRDSNLGVLRASGAKQWVWTSRRNKYVCAACLAMDGTIHDMDEPLVSHPHCKCIPCPLGEWAALRRTGAQWLREQEAATQRSVIGSKSGYELYRSGKVSLSDFAGFHQHQGVASLYQRPVKQLKSKRKIA